MPPNLALFLTLGFIVYLFRRDVRQKPNITGALWLPVLWMLLICSRAPTEWLGILGFPGFGGPSLEEGSTLDAVIYSAFIVAGLYVLDKRQVNVSEVFRNNGWLLAFLIYCFIAILWSDFPFVSFKRWIKMLAHPIMVLVLITEPDPREALRRLMKRCAYVVIPISICLIKYFPTIGRRAGPWSTMSQNIGISTGKNHLGTDCLILSIFFIWHLLQTWRAKKGKVRRNELFLIAGFLLGIGWLLRIADSSTPKMCLVVSVMIMVSVGFPFVNKRMIGAYVLMGVAILLLAEVIFGISDLVVEALGRDSTLTGRTELWKHLLSLDTNPIFGTGFESFWLGDRLKTAGQWFWWQPNEAHNGYLEIYLNIGLIGLAIMIGWIIDTFRKSRLELLRDFEFGRFRLAFLATVVLYNLAESAFKPLNPVSFAFYIIALDYPKRQAESVAEPSEMTGVEEEMDLAYSEGRLT